MKQFSSALFPLTIATILAGLSYALQWYVQAPESTHSEVAEHKPDAVVSEVEIFRIGSRGEIKYRLTSPRLLHFRDDDSTILEQPRLQHFREEGPPASIRSRRGHINGGATVVQFNGAVQLNRPAFRDSPAMKAEMAALTVYPESGKAETTSPVVLQRGAMWLKGIGMSIDQNRQLYTLHQQARGFYPPVNRPNLTPTTPTP